MWEKEMQLRRKQRATRRARDGDPDRHIFETQQQQDHTNKDDRKRKEMTKPNHTTELIQEWLALITQLDGTGGHEPILKRT
jgi:hypothetical protein